MTEEHEIEARIRRMYPGPSDLPTSDDPWAKHLLEAIMATEEPEQSPRPSPRRHPTRRRAQVLAASFVTLCVAATAVASVVIIRGNEPPQPLGANMPVSLLEDLEAPGSESMPADLHLYAQDKMDVSRTRLVAEHDGMKVYLGPELGAEATADADPASPPQVCLYAARWDAAGPSGAYGCGPAWAGTGLLQATLQTRPGGTEVPRVRFGLVPDGITQVSLPGGASATVTRNIYALPLTSAEEASDLIFTHDDGSETRIRVAGG